MMLRTGALIAAALSVIAAEHCEVVVDGVRQSPINIDTSTVIPGLATSLKWSSGYHEMLEAVTLVDDGHSLKLSVNTSIPIQLSGGVLDLPYDFQQLHFHWGDSDGKGSEHKIMDNTYPLEMHVLHSQSTSNDTDEFIVVGYFFRVSQRMNRGFQNVIDAALAAAENRNIPVNVAPFILSELVPTGPFSYYTYKGSLTTPPYSETVTWIVASTALPISQAQLDTLRAAAQIDDELLDNFRCLQNLNGRPIGYVVPLN